MEKEIKNIIDAKKALDNLLEKENIFETEIIEGIIQILNFLYQLLISPQEINVNFFL